MAEEDDFLALGDDVMSSLRELKKEVGPVAAASDEPPKRKKLYDTKPRKGKSGGDVAGAVLNRPGDATAQRKLDRAAPKAAASTPPRMSSTRAKAKQASAPPVGGVADDDIMDSVKPVKGEAASNKMASDDDVARLNKLFGL